jgi:hypothetical protein
LKKIPIPLEFLLITINRNRRGGKSIIKSSVGSHRFRSTARIRREMSYIPDVSQDSLIRLSLPPLTHFDLRTLQTTSVQSESCVPHSNFQGSRSKEKGAIWKPLRCPVFSQVVI